MRAVLFWVITFISLSFLIGGLITGVVLELSDWLKASNRLRICLAVVFVALTIYFIVIPLDNKMLREQKKVWIAQEKNYRDLVTEMVEDYLKENHITMSATKRRSLIEDAYYYRWVHEDDDSIWLDERSLAEQIDFYCYDH